MEKRTPETKRRARLSGPPVAFVGGILAIATLLILVLLVVYALGGCGAEGTEGA